MSPSHREDDEESSSLLPEHTSPGYGTLSGTSEIPSPTIDIPPIRAPPKERNHGELRRGLSSRQVQMIAIAGTIGTGLFLGTGRSLAQGGPASMLICYGLVGSIVYVTLLLLGEMSTQYPVAGEYPSIFCCHIPSAGWYAPSYISFPSRTSRCERGHV